MESPGHTQPANAWPGDAEMLRVCASALEDVVVGDGEPGKMPDVGATGGAEGTRHGLGGVETVYLRVGRWRSPHAAAAAVRGTVHVGLEFWGQLQYTDPPPAFLEMLRSGPLGDANVELKPYYARYTAPGDVQAQPPPEWSPTRQSPHITVSAPLRLGDGWVGVLVELNCGGLCREGAWLEFEKRADGWILSDRQPAWQS